MHGQLLRKGVQEVNRSRVPRHRPRGHAARPRGRTGTLRSAASSTGFVLSCAVTVAAQPEAKEELLARTRRKGPTRECGDPLMDPQVGAVLCQPPRCLKSGRTTQHLRTAPHYIPDITGVSCFQGWRSPVPQRQALRRHVMFQRHHYLSSSVSLFQIGTGFPLSSRNFLVRKAVAPRPFFKDRAGRWSRAGAPPVRPGARPRRYPSQGQRGGRNRGCSR